jgi:hypothetical protein
MHEKPLLTTAPAPITSLPEFYAVAFHQAQRAMQHYSAALAHADQNVHALRPVFETLVSRENIRADAIAKACIEACGQPPDLKRLPADVIDLVPMQEVVDIADSRLSTPYAVWALAVRHRQRAFVFWTYIAALAGHSKVSAAAERLAREALSDGNLLRRERRLAWQSENRTATEDDQGDRDMSAALLESLLRRDMLAWSQTLPPAQSEQLLQAGALSSSDDVPPDDIETPAPGELEQVKQRALRRAEQLSNIYLDDADSATDQSSLEFAQKLAAHSISRLANLRAVAASRPRH